MRPAGALFGTFLTLREAEAYDADERPDRGGPAEKDDEKSAERAPRGVTALYAAVALFEALTWIAIGTYRLATLGEQATSAVWEACRERVATLFEVSAHQRTANANSPPIGVRRRDQFLHRRMDLSKSPLLRRRHRTP